MGLGGFLKKIVTLGQSGKKKDSGGMKDSLNQELGFLDATQQPHAEDSFYGYQSNANDLNSRIAGLYSPESYASANKGFDEGLATYEDRIGQMFGNAGYTPEEKQGQRTATEAGFAAPYAAANDAMKLNQVRTGQSAGVGSNIAKLARDRGQMISAGLGGLEKGFGDARMAQQNTTMGLSQFPQQARLQRMQGEKDIVGLQQGQGAQALQAYGTGLGGTTSATGMRLANVNNNPSFLKQLGSGIAGGLGKSIGGIGG